MAEEPTAAEDSHNTCAENKAWGLGSSLDRTLRVSFTSASQCHNMAGQPGISLWSFVCTDHAPAICFSELAAVIDSFHHVERLGGCIHAGRIVCIIA